MNFNQKLLSGRLYRRYQRFLADIDLDTGERITAHCPNTGSMRGLVESGLKVYVSRSANPQRKLAYTLELVDIGTSLVGVHTGRANGIVKESIIQGKITELLGYEKIRQEVPYGQNSRIDLLLENHPPQERCYVEIKSVTLKESKAALFPDAVTIRGAKHLDDLVNTIRSHHCRAMMLYLVQREDCEYFSPADDIDPIYGKKLRLATTQGLEAIAYSCQLSVTGIHLQHPLPVHL
ncbi:DNA/RNA nuclease SfsA [Candidatus Nitrosoglobus terrae]|nr:DNA/RNA nuclease SfsA [Candidatus Nitrosoglobus terrae]